MLFIFSGDKVEAVTETTFDLSGESFECFLFREEAPRKGIVAMLCADDLCVEEYHISKRFDVCRYLVSVKSGYLNQHSNIERQRIEIPKDDTDADMILPISRDSLLAAIHRECLALIDKVGERDIQIFKEHNVKRLKRYYPFIQQDLLGGNADLLDADEVVKVYRAQQARREDQVVELIDSGRNVSFDDISHLASDDLARFIVHRALVIESLAKMPPDSAEATLHSTILQKRSDGENIRDNNVWLIDDKFLSYSSIFSDETLAAIVQEVGNKTESTQQRRPDIAAFYSKNNEGDPNKLVIIEFKKLDAGVFEGNKALLQCRLYAGELVSRINTVREVFAFAIANIDDDFYNDMKVSGYKDVFSTTERVLYTDFSIGQDNKIPLHLYVMPASAMINDARARNRVFEEILQFDCKKSDQPT